MLWGKFGEIGKFYIQAEFEVLSISQNKSMPNAKQNLPVALKMKKIWSINFEGIAFI